MMVTILRGSKVEVVGKKKKLGPSEHNSGEFGPDHL